VPREYQSELNRAGSRVISVPSMRGTLNLEHVSYSNGRFRYVLPLALSWTVQLLAGRPLFKQISSAFRLTLHSDVPVSLNYFQREVARYLVSVYPRPCEDESFEIAALSSVNLQDIRASFSNIHPIRTESLERRCILSPCLSLFHLLVRSIRWAMGETESVVRISGGIPNRRGNPRHLEIDGARFRCNWRHRVRVTSPTSSPTSRSRVYVADTETERERERARERAFSGTGRGEGRGRRPARGDSRYVPRYANGYVGGVHARYYSQDR